MKVVRESTLNLPNANKTMFIIAVQNASLLVKKVLMNGQQTYHVTNFALILKK
jgi:hypothetical protein